jgi:hypothetical protein
MFIKVLCGPKSHSRHGGEVINSISMLGTEPSDQVSHCIDSVAY